MILLDTCTLIWLTSDHRKLSTKARRLISDSVGALYVSSMSAFEIGVKSRKGKLKLSLDPRSWFFTALERHGIREIPVDADTAIESTALPGLHGDPVDRIIIATAVRNGLTVLTPDRLIQKYDPVKVQW